MRILWGEHLTLPDFFQRELFKAWNDWLRGRYDTTKGLAEAWAGLLPGESLAKDTVLLLPLLGRTSADKLAETLGLEVKFAQPAYGPGDFSKKRAADVVEFLTTIHLDYKQAAARVFKSQGRPGLGCRIVPLVYDTGYSGALLPYYMHSHADATACGAYPDLSTHDPAAPTFPFASGLARPPRWTVWRLGARLRAPSAA